MKSTLGEWRWIGAVKRLDLTIENQRDYAVLDGQWDLNDFGVLLDGLSARRVDESLQNGKSSVTCELCLADGRNVQMIGAFTDPRNASGVLLGDASLDEPVEEPGPELVPVFQPIISLSDGRVAGFEALARWPIAAGEEVSTTQYRFDDKALASSMLIHGCDALSVWRDTLGRDDIFMHVNLTARDLADTGLVDLVQALISGHGLSNGQLRLELTEQAALRNAARAVDVARELQDMGVGLVLDDFGTGHSSFMWLANLPAGSLKIDQDLIALYENPRVRTILEALTLMARRLGMKTTAEGVEKAEMLPRLREMGFDYAQGFALQRPMQLETATDYLQKRVTA